MTFIPSLINFLLADVKTVLICLLIFYLVYRVTTFYSRVYSLPPGPFPLPFVGNMIDFSRGTGQNWSIMLGNIAKRFGPVFTVWYGETPRVIVTEIDLLRDKFRTTEFAGRRLDLMSEVFLKSNSQNIILANYGPTWEVLRRVSHTAVMRYAASQQLNDVVIDCVDHTVDLMVKTEGLNEPFVPFEYIVNMFLNIMAASAFGKRYELDDPEYKIYKYLGTLKEVHEEYDDILGYWNTFPITRFGKRWNKFRNMFESFADHMITKFINHYKDYDENVIRDFCDTLITAKNEAYKVGKESATHLTDENLAMAVTDLFFAGTDTSQNTFRWIVLHMLYNREFLAKLRHEIDVEIGDRMPTHEDKSRCHYVLAFISEVMRHSYIVPIMVPHTTVVDCQLEGYTVPKDTEVVGLATHIMKQGEHFAEPDIFRPERFLDCNGHYVETKHKAFIPFGVGRRKCLGENMAITDLFLVLVRFLQKTSKYRIGFHMEDKEPLIPDPNIINEFAVIPKEFRISLNTI